LSLTQKSGKRGRSAKVSLIEQAKGLGFVGVGFSRPAKPLFFDQFCEWISAGKQGEMGWMGRHLNLRKNPSTLLEDCHTIITLAYPYSPKKPCTPEGLSAARYSEPQEIDYHDRLKKKAKILAGAVQQQYPGTQTRVCVDSAPILERSFAYQSGIGFIGKNNMFMIPGYGSYLFLAEILTSALLSYPETELMESRCGSCTRCLEACPTGALEAPYRLNAARCLSYLTIEKGGPVDNETANQIGDCFLGCDVCQEVCPLNKGDESKSVVLPSIDEILNMNDETFKEVFGRTAFARAGLGKIRDNINAVLRFSE
jgi:epoxyqueuosine reductase